MLIHLWSYNLVNYFYLAWFQKKIFLLSSPINSYTPVLFFARLLKSCEYPPVLTFLTAVCLRNSLIRLLSPLENTVLLPILKQWYHHILVIPLTVFCTQNYLMIDRLRKSNRRSRIQLTLLLIYFNMYSESQFFSK